jgi:predicted nucleotidyltransferase
MMKTARKYYAITDIKIMRFFLSSRVFAISIHWIFQSMLHMDVTELLFKLCIDIVLTIVFYTILANLLPFILALLLSFLLAHTLNFLFNGQMFVVLKSFGDITHELPEFEQCLKAIENRLNKEPSIRWAAVYGSMARGELKTTSDLDIRFIRYPGFRNAVRACWFVLLERTRANLDRFPIDFLVLDSTRLLKRLRYDEPPLVIYDASLDPGKNHGDPGTS